MSNLTQKYGHLSPVKQALLALEHVQGQSKHQSEPIAVIGMGCRFPGGANDPESFWQLLRQGKDAIDVIPSSRWESAAHYDADPNAIGKMYTQQGGFLQTPVDEFDAGFFGLTPKEIISMDPQQRLLMEISWEALEHAGHSPKALAGSQVGTFVGLNAADYSQLHFQAGDPEQLNAYFFTGNTASVAAGRISYLLGLQGPCLAIDTACSSSLVTIHLACQSLRSQECNLALAGGVNLMLSPDSTIILSRMRALATDGRCKTFDASADGYGRGEGCGIVILKRLSDAIGDRDNILAVVRGSAINHDGHSSGLTVPNGLAQQSVIQSALENAQLSPSDISYVEAHGTGTPLGDPIEIESLAQVLCQDRSPQNPLQLGSVKTNIGHLEAAAGIAGFIKSVLMLNHGEIPAHLHFKNPNSAIEWDALPINIPTQLTPWQEADGQQRLVGISAFGMSGTNAHVILGAAEALPAPPPAEQPPLERPLHVLTISAKSDRALKQLAVRFAQTLSLTPETDLADLCFTANCGRTHFNRRVALLAQSPAQLQTQLNNIAQGRSEYALLDRRNAPEVAFLLAGEITHQPSCEDWLLKGMAEDLYNTHPVFRHTLDRCDAILGKVLKVSIVEMLYSQILPNLAGDQLLHRAYLQPALFAIEYAFSQLWMSWGIEPTALVAQGVGEFVAACLAGVFSLQEGLSLTAALGQSIQSRLTEPAEKISASKKQFEQITASIAFQPPQIQLILGKTDRDTDADLITAAGYWVDVAEVIAMGEETAGSAVDLAAYAVAEHRLHQQKSCHLFIEIGSIAEGIESIEHGIRPSHTPPSSLTRIPSLEAHTPDWECLCKGLQQLYTQGVKIDWSGFEQGFLRTRMALPTYPFQRQRYWMSEPSQPFPTAPSVTAAEQFTDHHPLLRQRVPSTANRLDFQLRPQVFEDCHNHQIHGTKVLPTGSYLAVVMAAAAALNLESFTVSEGVIQEPFILSSSTPRTLSLQLILEDQNLTHFKIYSRPEPDDISAQEQVHFTGQVRQVSQPIPTQNRCWLERVKDCLEPFPDINDYYSRLGQNGLEYGPLFQVIQQIWHQNDDVLCQLALPEELTAEELDLYEIHPALLEGCLQLLKGSLAMTAAEETSAQIYQPTSFRTFQRFKRPTTELWSHVLIRAKTEGSIKADVHLYDDQGYIVAEVLDVHCQPIDNTLSQQATQRCLSEWLYEIEWRPQPLPALSKSVSSPVISTQSLSPTAGKSPTKNPGHWLIFSDTEGIGDALAEELAQQGDTYHHVFPGEEYQPKEASQQTLNPGISSEFKQLLQDLDPDSTCQGIVYLWGISETFDVATTTAADLQSEQLQSCGGVIHLMQALVETKRQTQLWLVTQNVHPVETLSSALSRSSVSGSSLWGLGRSLSLEHPENWGGLIDLARIPAQQAARHLLLELRQGPEVTARESEVSFAGNSRYVARLTRTQAIQDLATPPLLSAEGTYLITGGLGGLGLKVADWMLTQGGRHLLLVGRRKPSAQVQKHLDRLTAAGAHIRVAQADVSNSMQMDALLTNIQPALKGVVHLAGVLDDGMIQQQNWQRFEKVMTPKVAGAWNLHRGTQSLSLDFFVLFSSIASFLGSPGQSNYAAANAFLDSLAHHRRSIGLPAVSLSWSAWENIGMAATVGNQGEARWKTMGVGVIPARQGMSVLGRLLQGPAHKMGVLPIDWSRLLTQFPVQQIPPLFEELQQTLPQATSRSGIETAEPILLHHLRSAPVSQRARVLTEALQQEVADVMGHAQQTLDPHLGFFDMGIDSLMTVDLRNRLQISLGQSLPSTLVLEYPTIAALVAYLLSEGLTLEPPDSPPDSATIVDNPVEDTAELEEIKQLSTPELEARIEEELASLMKFS